MPNHVSFLKNPHTLGAIALFLALAGVIFALGPEEKQPPSKQIKTVKFSIFQNPAVLVNGNSTTTPFSVFIGEQSPVIKDAYVEISGVSQDVVSSLTADIRNTGGATCGESFATARAKTFTIDSTGQQNHFQLFYTGTGTTTTASLFYCLEQIIVYPGTYSFELKSDISGGDVSALQARLVVTYQYTPPSESSGISATGELSSAVFDTGASSGVAYNSIMWKGTEGTGKIRFQLATSQCSNGASDYPSCSLGTWSFKGGSTCGSGDWYDTLTSGNGGGPNKPVEITCAPANHNNHRYFRYKIQICSNTDCSTSGVTSPTVDDIVVNWAP